MPPMPNTMSLCKNMHTIFTIVAHTSLRPSIDHIIYDIYNHKVDVTKHTHAHKHSQITKECAYAAR